MSLIIRNALLFDPMAEGSPPPRTGHLVIEGDAILGVYAAGEPVPTGDEVIDGTGFLVMPGLVNAHLHSAENLFKGMFDNLPLELWMLYTYPPVEFGPFSARFIYLRTLLGAIEMVRGGVTTVQDDVGEWPTPSVEGMSAVIEAYLDVGLRANVAANLNNKPWFRKLPFVEAELSPEWIRRLEAAEDADYLLAVTRSLVQKWQGADGRIGYVVAPSAPQRCTENFLGDLGALAASHNLPLHTHVLETRMQRVTGTEMYDMSLIAYLGRLGLLTPRLTVVHSVWVSREDIEQMGDRRVTVVHNPASNLKLGSGIMPFRRLLQAGVNVALGSDGMSSNDSQSLFEAMKLTALLHKITSPDYTTWPTAGEVLRAAIGGGAISTGWGDRIGRLAPGAKADVLMIRLDSTAFTPLTDVANQLVYCEQGQSVDTVIVGGRVVMRDRRLTTIDEKAVLEELRALTGEFYREFARTREKVDALYAVVDRAYRRAAAAEVGLNRWLTYEWDRPGD